MANDPTANELLHDALVRRQLYLTRYGNHVSAEVIKLLDDTESALRDELAGRLSDLEGADGTLRDFGKTTNSRLRVLSNSIGKLRKAAFEDAGDVWDESMDALVQDEAAYLNKAYQKYSPVVLDTVLPDAATLEYIVDHTPIQGRGFDVWQSNLADQDMARIMDAVNIGMAKGDTTPDIINAIFGSKRLNGADGILETTRANALTITQTALSTFANGARAAFYEANSDVIGQEMWTATLDPNTCLECMALDGQKFDVGDGPDAPLHWRCRCVRVGLLDGDALGSRPTNSAFEDILGDLEGDEREDMVRELVGQVPASVNYQEFLTRQSAAFQDHVLGPARGKLFRSGEYKLSQFVDKGGVLTLAELGE